MKRWKRLLLVAAFAGLTSVASNAAVIGSFNLSGDIFVNGISSLTWTNPMGVSSMATISEATGIYSGLNGQNVTIETLNSSTDPTSAPGASGPGFPDTLFIVFPTSSGLASLNINTIYGGVDGSAQCSATPSAGPPAQVCTPALPTGFSPFNLENNPPSTSITSTGSFAFSGDVAAMPQATWVANFTTQFTVPYQTVLAELGPSGTGTVSDAYSATFTVSSPVPETSTLSMLGLGFGLILISRVARGLTSKVRI